MDILFASKKLETLCHEQTVATSTLGELCARKLRARLDDLRAAKSLAVGFSLPGRFHPLVHDRAGQYAFYLHGGTRLVLAPAHNPVPTLPDGSPDLHKVTIIRVVFIGNYHG